MSHYKIVYLKEKTKRMVDIYPCLVELLYQKQDHPYIAKQIELLFEPIHMGKEKLLERIQTREDYTYFHGIHQIENVITHEKITIQMNEYDIEVYESGEKCVIFEIMRGFSNNFCMIKA